MNKILILVAAVLLLVVVGGGAYYAGTMKNQSSQAVDRSASSTGAQPVGNAATPVDLGKLTWNFVAVADATSTDGPKTKVTLTASGNDKTYDLGTYVGSCSVVEGSSWKLLAGEKSGAICFWAGGGTELGIFEENGRTVVKAGAVDEGDAETPGTRDNFKTLLGLN